MDRFEMPINPIRKQEAEHYPGYPTHRLKLSVEEQALEGIDLPSGEWDYNTDPLPSAEESARLSAAGYRLDALGRPLHPWAELLLSPENGGAVLGKGAYWHWGPNRTADPIVITLEARPQILLIKRSDTGALALPGGFIDDNEDSLAAARRELKEETGLALQSPGELVYDGPVADLRTTLHAWAATSAYVFTVDSQKTVTGSDDALEAGWYYIDELPDTLFGSHAFLVKKALEIVPSASLSVREILALPESMKHITHIQAGHMAYHHYITEYDKVRLFVKEHDPQQFSDDLREAHSRAYLTKEHAHYKHLESQGFTAIPRKVDIIDDRLLAMEHFDEQDGWRWRAPEDSTTAYIRDALRAFDALAEVPAIEASAFHQAIAPTYETFWREGWDSLTNDVQQVLIKKVPQLSSRWEPAQQRYAQELVDRLPDLQSFSTTVSRETALYFAHNDARQSNIAWHPEQGIRLVDWSWADKAPLHADATMLLIDLAKSGHNVDDYITHFNPNYALTLIGFWLAHTTWHTRDGSTTVREHQLASATTAHQLLKRHFSGYY